MVQKADQNGLSDVIIRLWQADHNLEHWCYQVQAGRVPRVYQERPASSGSQGFIRKYSVARGTSDSSDAGIVLSGSLTLIASTATNPAGPGQ